MKTKVQISFELDETEEKKIGQEIINLITKEIKKVTIDKTSLKTAVKNMLEYSLESMVEDFGFQNKLLKPISDRIIDNVTESFKK